MDNEACSLALKNSLDEIQKICPDIKHAFLFTQDGKLVATADSTPEKTTVKTIETLQSVLEKAEPIGGVEDMTLEGIDCRVNVALMDKFYLLTAVSTKADTKYVDTVTRVLIPTVLKLLAKLNPAPIDGGPQKVGPEPEVPLTETPEELQPETVEKPEEDEDRQSADVKAESEPILPEPPVNQFIVEDIKGLLTPSDTVRIDSDIIDKWKELYEDREIEEADVETFGGKSVRCRVKPIKDSKLEGQGKIQIPSKVQFALEIRKGELVRVKPAIE